MKQLITLLAVVIVLSSCTKQEILEPVSQEQQAVPLSTEIPVAFSYTTPPCERPEIIFRGETYSDITTITSDSTVNLRSDQLYTVTFRLKAERCTSGSIILGGENPDEINFWMGSFPAMSEKQHVNLEAKYNVLVLEE
jgi:hypothetical protein